MHLHDYQNHKASQQIVVTYKEVVGVIYDKATKRLKDNKYALDVIENNPSLPNREFLLAAHKKTLNNIKHNVETEIDRAILNKQEAELAIQQHKQKLNLVWDSNKNE